MVSKPGELYEGESTGLPCEAAKPGCHECTVLRAHGTQGEGEQRPFLAGPATVGIVPVIPDIRSTAVRVVPAVPDVGSTAVGVVPAVPDIRFAAIGVVLSPMFVLRPLGQ